MMVNSDGSACLPPPRRKFLQRLGWLASGAICKSQSSSDTSIPVFRTDHAKLQTKYNEALNTLHVNTRLVNGYDKPVLIEGSTYGGIWLECGPQEGQVYGLFDLDTARANQEVFFDRQRDDGYLPYSVKFDRMGSSQIQMVVPIAATALEVFEKIGDARFLEKAYTACSRWDAWLVRYRNTRNTGLCEAFCEYDTGHDHSPRWQGLPKTCPNGDARLCANDPRLPYLAPDLSATVYGGRRALATMARLLGAKNEADRWEEKAQDIASRIIARLYDPDTACFYDVNGQNQFVRIRGDVLTRVLGEHVVTQPIFEEIYRRQIRNPSAFWTPYPFPSIALDDPSFVRPIPRNSWGGASQALTALRAPRWMEYYGKYADLTQLMGRWVSAILEAADFLQQLDPQTGAFTPDRAGYSPTALVLLDFIWRLHGVRAAGQELEWNCRMPIGAFSCSCALRTPHGIAALEHTPNQSKLTLAGKPILVVQGEARIITKYDGSLLRVEGTQPEETTVRLLLSGHAARSLSVKPNTAVRL
jgi:hypothetical protein